MTEVYRTFHGKILLFGEYTIITGSKALVIPLKQFSGRLAYPVSEINNPDIMTSRRSLNAFFEYLSNMQESSRTDLEKVTRGDEDRGLIDLERLGEELERGLFFRSSIPQEYGAGSSAALVAAIYDAFASNKINYNSERTEDMLMLRQIFSKMESHFHGTSSGIDPVCCYTGKTIFQDGVTLYTTEIQHLPESCKFFLADSGEKGETEPHVEGFNKRLSTDLAFTHVIEDEMTDMVNHCIHLLITGSMSYFAEALLKLSRLQLEHFDPMIPDPIRQFWIEGLQKEIFTLKLCGSGGGGFFLGYTDDPEATSMTFKQAGKKISMLDL
ncbi:MAG TPA: mevalonate kinase [Bacteroides sp.]|nr:mevalonate kinase [Bacteroides sp.]